MTQTKANIALLLGDPAGIGPELSFKSVTKKKLRIKQILL